MNKKKFVLISLVCIFIFIFFIIKINKKSKNNNINKLTFNDSKNYNFIFKKLLVQNYYKKYILLFRISKIYKKKRRIFFFETNIFPKYVIENIKVKLILKKNNKKIFDIYKNKITLDFFTFDKINIKNPQIIYSIYPNIRRILINLKKNKIIVFTQKDKKIIKLNN